MKIVIATPLYPPDTALSARYAKELARRLAAMHDVTVVAYGRLPEHVEGVRVRSVSKSTLGPIRLARFFMALMRAMADADAVYVQNGASTELPAALASLARRTRFTLSMSDPDAIPARGWRGLIRRLALARARTILSSFPPCRPEILPFSPYPTDAMAAWNVAWERHLAELAAMHSHE